MYFTQSSEIAFAQSGGSKFAKGDTAMSGNAFDFDTAGPGLDPGRVFCLSVSDPNNTLPTG